LASESGIPVFHSHTPQCFTLTDNLRRERARTNESLASYIESKPFRGFSIINKKIRLTSSVCV